MGAGEGFLATIERDHPTVSWKKPQIFSKRRAVQECEPIVDNYFAKVKWAREWANWDGRTMPLWNEYGGDETPLRIKLSPTRSSPLPMYMQLSWQESILDW